MTPTRCIQHGRSHVHQHNTQRGLLALLLATLCLLLIACGDSEPQGPPAGEPLSQTQRKSLDAHPVRVIFLGDSLTAGYGLDVNQAYPAVVERLLRDEKLNVKIVNAGVSGDTTAGGLKRLNWLLQQKPDIVVVALGANDGLRAQDVEFSKKNLQAIIQTIQKAGANVLLLGMKMPPNYGPVYTAQFQKIYADLAKENHVTLMPFMLKGVGGDRSLNQADGIHPTAKGQEIIANNVLPYLRKLVKERVKAKSQGG